MPRKPRLYNRTTYAWKRGAVSSSGIDPQEAGERLLSLHARHGNLTPQAVVDDARPEDSPLHDAFEWDDARAADAHRLEQARSLIRSVVIVSEKTGERESRAFFHVVESEGYVSRDKVLSVDALRASVLLRIVGRLRADREAMREFEELSGVVAAIDALDVVPQRKAA